jgi:hypothetical protein
MAGLYWFRPMFEIVKGDWKWKIGPFFLTPGGRALMDESPSLFHSSCLWKDEIFPSFFVVKFREIFSLIN